MTSRPPSSDTRPTAAVTTRLGGRAARGVCVALLGVLTMTACSGGDSSTAAPPATEEEPSATQSATPEPGTPTATEAGDMVDRADPATFDHDQVRPVDLEEVGPDASAPVEMIRIQFPSQDGGMATGFLAPPAEPASDAGILWAHGLPGDGRDSWAPMAVFACAGVTSITVNAPYARPTTSRPDGAVTNGARPLTYSPTDRDEQIQLIRDMRRAIDVLQDRGIDRIGFGGISYGAAMGAALIGVDDRIEAAKLTLGNGGLVDRFTDEDGAPIEDLDDLTAGEFDTWVEAMLPIEPARFVGDSSADIVFLNGRNDPIIPLEEAERFHAAAPAGEVRWMNDGHDVSYADFLWHNRWLGTRLGIDAERLDACAEELFPGGW
jgi:predicted esterase